MERKIKQSKIVVLGEARVGKTSLTQRFCNQMFDDHQESSVDASFQERMITVREQKVKLVIWDTAGQEKYHALNQVYYKGSEGALIVYDITDLDSFHKVDMWVKELRKYLPANTPIHIAGNKCDIPHNRQIDEEDAVRYANSISAKHFSTSAKTGMGVEQLFSSLSEEILDSLKDKSQEKKKMAGRANGLIVEEFNPEQHNNITLDQNAGQQAEKQKKKKCC